MKSNDLEIHEDALNIIQMFFIEKYPEKLTEFADYVLHVMQFDCDYADVPHRYKSALLAIKEMSNHDSVSINAKADLRIAELKLECLDKDL